MDLWEGLRSRFMLGIVKNDATRCRYCGEKLPLLQRLSRAEYCNNAHREAFIKDQEKLALGRLQQLVSEAREAEIQSRLPKAPPTVAEWPEDPDGPAISGAETTVAGVTHAEPESEPATSAQRLCGPIYGSDIAAAGRLGPAAAAVEVEDLRPARRKMPGTETGRRQPGVQTSARTVQVPVGSADGDRHWQTPPCHNVPVPRGRTRFPALSIESVDWQEALERTRRLWATIPPLAGLIQIAGPQTLRFTARLRTPLPQPETPAGNVVRAYKPGLARGAGMPGMAGAIRGLGTFRTRFGTEGSLQPMWEGELAEMRLAPDWTPRYPVFYTTSPWKGEGLEDIFGLGPGNGPSVELGESVPREVTGQFVVSTGDGAQEVSGTGSSRTGAQEATPGTTGEGEAGAGSVKSDQGAGLAGSGMAGFDRVDNGARAHIGGASAGRGAGPLPGSGTGTGWGSGDGRGTVSVEAVAALVKAARQSDRTRTPLRDIEIQLLSRRAAPKMAACRRWRGLAEGAARGLAERGPILTKAPMEPHLAAVEAVWKKLAPEITPAPVRPCLLPQPAATLAVRAGLSPAPRQSWPGAWLRPVPGPCENNLIEASACEARAAVQVPGHAPEITANTGRAGRLQDRAGLPEPWVVMQANAASRGPAGAEPVPCCFAPMVRKPDCLEETGGGPPPDHALGMGRIEQPGPRWVLLRGSEEAATFRLALEALRSQEPGAPRAEWGLVAAHRSEARPAGLPPSRGFVHRDLSLQRANGAGPWLEPVLCQFGSARGGLWDSRM